MLAVKNLHVKINDKTILNGLNLTINPGEIHAIMGPNGSGKSTLANVIAGHPDYQISKGEIYFSQDNITDALPEERARKGLFLSFQYPVEIPGVNNLYFIKEAANAIRKESGLTEYDAFDFMSLAKAKMKELKMDESMLKRSVNEGFSGGEKKRNEILQMAILEPKLAILDEIDSGLDIDALKIVAEGINALRSPERSMILVTHYQRLLNYVEPDFVHILHNGRIIKSGDKSLAQKLEEHGYDWAIEEAKN